MVQLLTWLTVFLAAPTGGATESIGGYANGCLKQGVQLGAKGPGWETIRRHRKRYFTHPALRTFVQDYGEALVSAGIRPVLVGDTSQAGGGRMPSGHSSHQTGLDVDLWFTRPEKRGADRHFASMVDGAREVIAPTFTPEKREMLRIAAQDPRTARVFVHWVIKRTLCETVEGDRAWLAKIRPWWGHDRHFHVRLRCPEGSADCENQAAPTGDGCGQESWFSKAEVAAREAKGEKPAKKRRRPLHPRCRSGR